MKAPRILVVGGANLDIKVQARSRIQSGDSAPGTLNWTPGGVGRNIAENLSHLGASVSLITAVGRDPMAELVLSPTRQAGVDTSGVIRVDVPTGCYTAMLDRRGEMQGAVAAMDVLDSLTPYRLKEFADRIRSVDLVIADTNLLPQTLAHIVKWTARWNVPLAIDPVSAAKAMKLKPLLRHAVPIQLLTPNRAELCVLADESKTGLIAMKRGAVRLHRQGVGMILAGLGKDGALISQPDYQVRLPSLADTITDVTGAGDAASAAFCFAWLLGYDPVAAGLLAQAASSIVLADRASSSVRLTWPAVKKRAGLTKGFIR